MNEITVVSLGVSADGLTLGALEAMKQAKRVILRTAQTPAAAYLDEQGIAYSSLDPLYETAEDFDSLKTVEDMAGKKVGAQLGSLQQGILEEQFSASEPLLLEKIHILALELDQGNIDGWLITDLVAKQYMAVYPGRFQISEVPVVYDSSAGIGVAVPKGDNASLLAVVNEYIAEIKADGTFDGWVDDAAAKGAGILAAENAE